MLNKICILGSGNWGSAIAKVIGNNVINLDIEKVKDFIDLLGKLDELEDVQNIYTNVNLDEA